MIICIFYAKNINISEINIKLRHWTPVEAATRLAYIVDL